MRVFIIMFFCMLGAISLTAQTIIKFNNKGELIPAGLPRKTPFKTATIQFAPPNPNMLSTAQKEIIRKKLLQKISTASDNIQDDSLGTRQFYSTCLWGSGVYNKMLRELEILKHYFTGAITDTAPPDGFTFQYFPSPKEFFDSVFNNNGMYRVDTVFKKNQLEVKLLFTDPFQRWLLNRYNASYTANAMETTQMNLAYKTGWRELESLYRNIQSAIGLLNSKKDNSDFCCDTTITKIRTFKDGIGVIIDRNSIVQQLKGNLFFKQWLWVNDGILAINPMSVTTPDKVYPKTEPYLFRDSVLSKYSLPVITLNQVQQATSVLNKVILPFDKENDIQVIYYDAAHDYAFDKKNLPPKNAAEDQQFAVAINNTPANTNVTLAVSSQVIPDQSGFQKQLGIVDSALVAVVGVISPLVTPWTASLSAIFNQKAPVPSNAGIPYSSSFTVTSQVPKDIKDNAVRDDNAPRHMKLRRLIRNITVKMDGGSVFLYCNEDQYNKTVILKLYKKCQCNNDRLIDRFVTGDTCHKIDCPDPASLQISIKALLERYDAFTKAACNKTINELIDQLKENARCLESYLKLYDRSLPPDSLTVDTNDTPFLITKLKILPNDAPVKLTYGITEKKPIPGSKDSTSIDGGSYSYNIGKKYSLQVSAGIAFTLKEYDRKIITTGSNGQISVSDNNDKVRMVAGIHYYPCKLFLLDNSFLGISKGHFLNRISIFAGVGIPKPLENFYPALGLDIVPGLRVLGGAHLIKNTKYQINNNQIISQRSGLEYAALFASLNLDVMAFGKLIGVFK